MKNTMNTKAYLTWRKHSQEIIDFVVTSATGAGYLRDAMKNNVSAIEIAKTNALFDPTSPPLSTETKALLSYEPVLAATAFTAHYSQFESFVFSAIDEIIEFHGGAEQIRENLQRIKSRKPSEKTSKALSKLRTPRDKSKDMKYRTASASADGSEVVWPSQRFLSVGVVYVGRRNQEQKIEGA